MDSFFSFFSTFFLFFTKTQDVNLIEADIVAAGLSAGQCWANQPEFEITCENHGFTMASCPMENCHWNAGDSTCEL